MISILILLLLPSFASAIAVPGWPIVPCGLSKDNPATPDINEGTPCTRCDLFQLLKNIVDFTIGGLMPPVAVLLFVWAGFLILMGGANPGLVSKGKEIFSNTFFGIVIMLAAWMITNTIIQSVGSKYNNAQNWFQFTCVETAPVVPPVVGRPPSPVSVSASAAKAGELIRAITLNSFSSSGDCGSNFNARQNIQDIAGGRMPAVCSPSCSCQSGGSSGNITVNASLLEGLAKLSQRRINFTVTSLTTGRHSQGSSHYSGRGVDIVVSPNSPSVWIETRTFLNSLGGQAICESKSGNVVASCSPIPSVVDHIHWTR